MNRRSFLKRCSILPFVGSLAAVAKAGASEGKPVSLFGESDKDVPFSVHIPKKCLWPGKLKCGGQNGILCPRCKYCIEAAEKAANPPIYTKGKQEDNVIYEYFPLHQYLERAPYDKQIFGCFNHEGKLTGFYYKV